MKQSQKYPPRPRNLQEGEAEVAAVEIEEEKEAVGVKAREPTTNNHHLHPRHQIYYRLGTKSTGHLLQRKKQSASMPTMVGHAVRIAVFVAMVIQLAVTNAKTSKMAKLGISIQKEANCSQRRQTLIGT